jgi:hypothetical protein
LTPACREHRRDRLQTVAKPQPGDAILFTGPARRPPWMAWPACIATALSFPVPDLDTAIGALLEPHPGARAGSSDDAGANSTARRQ